MKKKTYLRPSLQMAPMDTEQIIANTPWAKSDDGEVNIPGGGDDDGSGGGGGGGPIWGDAKGQVDWEDMW